MPLHRRHSTVSSRNHFRSLAACTGPRGNAPGMLAKPLGMRGAHREWTPMLLLLAVVLAWAVAPAAAQTPTLTFQVNSTADAADRVPGDGKCATGNFINGSTTPQCTLRAAIDEANALSKMTPSSSYAISLPSGTYSLTVNDSCIIGTSTVTGIPLCLSGNISINGPTSGSPAVIDAGGTDNAMRIPSGGVVKLANVTLQNGFDAENYVPIGGGGGAIHSEGTLTLSHCLFTENQSHNDLGSAVYNGGISLTVEGSTFQGNSGAVLAVNNLASTVIGQSYFTDNSARNGVAFTSLGNPGPLTISNSTFTQNSATADNVIFLSGNNNPILTITNSTISFNTVGVAYIINTTGTAILNNDTVYGNTTGGESVYGANSLTMSNSIVYDTGGQSVCNTFTDLGHNFIGSTATCFGTYAPAPTTQIGVDPQMGAIILDGGSVPVQLPLPGSPVIGGGSTATPGGNASGACSALDENGKPRGVGATCTVGAVEPLVGLQVNDIVPAQGGIGGNVTMQITGFGFDPSSTVALHLSGQTDLAPKVFSLSADGTAMTAAFSLVGAAAGTYDVVLTTSASSVTLPKAFTVANAISPVLESFLSGPTLLRPGRAGTFLLTYTNTGNTDAYLVPLYFSFPNGFTGSIKGLQSPPLNNQQVLTDYSTDSLGLLSATASASPAVNIALLLPVIPAGSKNTLTFTVSAVGSEGTPFTLLQQLGTPYSSNADTGVADASAINMVVTNAVLNDTANLGVTPSASAQSAMGTYANSQLIAVVGAGETALLQTFGAAPVVYSIPQLLDDVGAYGAAYTSSQPAPGGIRPMFIPGLTNNPPPGGCGGTPMAPGGSCFAGYTPFPSGPPMDGPAPPAGGTPGGGNLVGSVDPNLKTGPLGAGAAHYTQANSLFPYLIEFENEAAATAPAQAVTVTDTIDTTKLDLSTFQFGPISFGSTPFVLNPPAGTTSFQGSIDLRPAQDIIVDVTANLNATTGVITWNFLSLDPATMQLTTDPTAGFLPPDTMPPAGIGHVAFSMTPLASVADTAQICNTGVVVFDTNAPISTAQYCNTKDISTPTSMVQALAALQMSTAFPVVWSGADTGSGVGTYAIYSNLDGGAFTPWLTATPATTATFTGLPGHTYGFYSIATDQAGNVEAAKTQAEAMTYIGVAAGSFSPGTVTFPATAMGQTSSAAVTLTSNGAMPLNVTGFTLSDASDFTETDTCIATSPIAVGQTCTVTVTFAPGSSASLTGPVIATLSAISNAPTAPTPVALSGTVDLPQSVWLANGNGTLARFANSGAAATPASGLMNGGSGIAIDQAGDVWSGITGGTSVVEFDNTGVMLRTIAGGGIASPVALAISGSGHVWIANTNNTLSLLKSDGTVISSASGLSGEPLSTPSDLAIDASGSVWVSNAGDSSVTQFLGAADPVVTPLVNAVKTGMLGTKP